MTVPIPGNGRFHRTLPFLRFVSAPRSRLRAVAAAAETGVLCQDQVGPYWSGLLRMKLSELIFILSVSFCAARGPERDVGEEVDMATTSGCCNLTRLFENWRSSIMAQVKDLLLRHHETVLPDYSRIAPMSESLQTLDKKFKETRQEVEELTAAFSSFRGLLRRLSSGQNVSRTSGVIVRRIRKKKPPLDVGTDISRRNPRKRPVIQTGQSFQNRPRKKVRTPRLRTRLPASRAQRSSSPRTCSCVPIYFLCFFIIFNVSFS